MNINETKLIQIIREIDSRTQNNKLEKFSDITDKVLRNLALKLKNSSSMHKTLDVNQTVSMMNPVVDAWKKLPDMVQVYRAVYMKNKNNASGRIEAGTAWVHDKKLINKNFLQSSTLYGLGGSDDTSGYGVYLVGAEVPQSNIDVEATILSNMGNPDMHEIALKDKGKNVSTENLGKLDIDKITGRRPATKKVKR
jgi:hypothetical protein